MADATANEVTKNSGDAVEVLPDTPTATASVQSGPNDPPRTEATDTRAPEDKFSTKAPKDPVQSAASTEKSTTAKTTAPKAPAAHKPAARATSKSEAKADEKPKAPRAAKEWNYEAPSPALTTRIQRQMGRHGWYTKPADGKFEEHSRQGVQRAIQGVGYEGAINGQIGEEQAKLIQKFAKKHGTYTGAVNGKVDDVVWAGFAVALERLP